MGPGTLLGVERVPKISDFDESHARQRFTQDAHAAVIVHKLPPTSLESLLCHL